MAFSDCASLALPPEAGLPLESWSGGTRTCTHLPAVPRRPPLDTISCFLYVPAASTWPCSYGADQDGGRDAGEHGEGGSGASAAAVLTGHAVRVLLRLVATEGGAVLAFATRLHSGPCPCIASHPISVDIQFKLGGGAQASWGVTTSTASRGA